MGSQHLIMRSDRVLTIAKQCNSICCLRMGPEKGIWNNNGAGSNDRARTRDGAVTSDGAGTSIGIGGGPKNRLLVLLVFGTLK